MGSKWFLVIAAGLFLVSISPCSAQSGLSLTNISDNKSSYQNNQIPKYEKYEISFQVNNTTATNLQFPYDASVVAGLTPGVGITVNAIFTDPDGLTYTQPAFYYEDFDYQVKNNRDWVYPLGTKAWKVRFSPHKIGNWQYRLTAQDKSGSVQSSMYSFEVANSANKGFIRVSKNDSRYFEYEDGSYFPALGYNMNYNQISWESPVTGNSTNFRIMGQNGIQLIRMWMTQWPIFGTAGSIWRNASIGEFMQVAADYAYPGHDFSNSLDTDWQRLYGMNGSYISLGWNHRGIGIKPNTKYKMSVRFFTPRPLVCNGGGANCGFVAKLGAANPVNDWLEDPTLPTAGVKITNIKNTSGSGWDIISGEWTTGNIDYLPMIYLTMEGVSLPSTPNQVFIDQALLQEVRADGSLGPSILPQSTMAYHLNFDQYYSYVFDKVLELAKQHNVYLKVVGLEKTDYIMNHIDYDGRNLLDSDRTTCPMNGDGSMCFYGNGSGLMTKVYWLQRAWWRYQQARWGYSTNIHSWELLNEGNPSTINHYYLANSYGQFMHQFKPNDHLVTTSMWAGFPKNEFYANAKYPYIDYGDFHRYIALDNANASGFYDTAHATYQAAPGGPLGSLPLNQLIAGTNKPVMRGETGWILTDANTDGVANLTSDPAGSWLHYFVWGGINPGGLIDSGNWYPLQHIYPISGDGRSIYGTYYRFIQNIPLSNGRYVDAAATVSNGIRAWGQKDTVNGRAHLWISNSNFRWNNPDTRVVSGTITLSGFTANQSYPAAWWDTDTGALTSTQTLTASANGTLSLTVNSPKDLAIKIGNYSNTVPPTPPPAAIKPGDANGDNRVDGVDYMVWRNHYNQNISGRQNGDFDGSSKVDGVDYMIWRNNYGK